MDITFENRAIMVESAPKDAHRRLRARERTAKRRQNETPEQTALRRLQDRKRAADRRRNESAEEKWVRRKRDRERKSRGRRGEIERGVQRRQRERTDQHLQGTFLPCCEENDMYTTGSRFQLQFVEKDNENVESICHADFDDMNATTRSQPAYESLSSTDSLFGNFFLPEQTEAEHQIKQERQMALAQSPQMAAQPFPSCPQMQLSPLPATQISPGQEHVLTPPVQVAATKPNPVEQSRPGGKRILAVANHQHGVMSNLATLWKRGKLCDAGIGNGSTTVKVHKVVLTAVCPKLLTVFSANTLSQKFMQVNFPEKVSEEALKAFAEYMYNGLLDLDHEILEQLKIIANKLDMVKFEALCDSNLPDYMRQPPSTAASFDAVPLIHTTMPSTLTTTPELIDIKQEISDDELAQVLFSQDLNMASSAPKKSGATAGLVSNSNIKTEPVGPEDDKYGRLNVNRSNRPCTSTIPPPSSPSIVAEASVSTSMASAPVSSTEFAIPFSRATDVESTRLKASHSYGAPLLSDMYPDSGIVGIMHSQSNQMYKESCGTLSRPLIATSSTVSQSKGTINQVFPGGLFPSGGDNLPFITTPIADGKSLNLYKTDLT